MITKFKLFESHSDDIINSVSPEFWKMVEVVDWNSTIKGYRSSKTYHEDYMNYYSEAQSRLFFNYEFNQLKYFKEEYDEIYYLLYDEFDSISDKCQVSDDGYTDLISSVVGKGKEWVRKCIENPKLVIKMGKDRDYMENFGYLFSVSQEEYWEILDKFYPNDTRVIARKYNL